MSKNSQMDLVERLHASNKKLNHSEYDLERKKDRQAAIWLCLACMAFYLILTQGFITGQGYDNENFYTAKSLVEQGKPIVATAEPLTYPRNGILQPILMVPWYLFTKYFGWLVPAEFGPEWLAAWFNPFLTTLTVLYIYLFVLKLGFGRQAALISSILAATTSMLVPYSQIGMETFQTLTAIMAAYYLYSFKKTGNRLDLLWAGLSAGLLLGSKQLSPPLLVPIGFYLVYVLYSRWGIRNKNFWLGGLLWLAPFLAIVGIIVWFYTLRANSATSVLKFASELGNLDWRLVGLYSYTLSLNKGFFFYSPSALLAIFAFAGFWRKYCAEALLFVGIVAMALAIPSLTFLYGDDVWGPRYIDVLVPFSYVVAAYLFQAKISWSRFKRWCLLVLVVFSIYVQFIGSIYWYGRYNNILVQAGIGSQSTFGELTQVSQLVVHTQMLLSNVSASFFKTSLDLDYRAFYFWGLSDPPPRVDVSAGVPKLAIPKISLAPYARIENWGWAVLVRPPEKPLSTRIAAVFVLLVLLGLLVFSFLKLRKLWRATGSFNTNDDLAIRKAVIEHD